MTRFYMSLNCPECDHEILAGPYGTLVHAEDGRPVIPFDFAAQETFDCDECDATIHTGDFPLLVES